MLIIYALPEEYHLCSSRTSKEVPRTGILGHRRKKYNCHMHNEVEHITWYKGFSFPFRYKYLDPISTNYKIDILDTLGFSRVRNSESPMKVLKNWLNAWVQKF